MYIDNNTICIVDTSTATLWDYAENMEQAEDIMWDAYGKTQKSIDEWVDILKEHDTEQFRNYLESEKNRTFEIMTFEQFETLQREKILSDPMKEVDAEIFEEMLCVLPPIYWCTIDNVEMFCMSEMWTGTFTTQYAHDKKSNKFYSKMVDCADRSTWIHNFLK